MRLRTLANRLRKLPGGLTFTRQLTQPVRPSMASDSGAVRMSKVMARCRACGFEHGDATAPCTSCGHMEWGWWCEACVDWRDGKLCPVCGGFLLVPGEINLGSFPPFSNVRVHFTIRNPGKKPLEFSVYPDDLALNLHGARRTLAGGSSTDIYGMLVLGDFAPGRRTYKVRIEAETPVETTLVVEVVTPVVRMEFSPPAPSIRHVTPGKIARRAFTAKNTGNVTIAAKLSSSEPWLTVTPERLELIPDGFTTVNLAAKTRRTEHGKREATIRVESDHGEVWIVPVTLKLPEPKLEAQPVDLGTVCPDKAAYESVTLKNVGKVRVPCTLASDQPWLAVTPKRVNLPPGREKIVKLRALIPLEDKQGTLEGPREATISVVFEERELLRIPVLAVCHIPKPVLAPIRKQSLGSIANDAVVDRGFSISNKGDGRLHCTISANVPWIEMTTPELKVAPGKKRRVAFRIDTQKMPLGANLATVHVRSDGGNLDVLLSITIVEPRPELEVMGDAELGSASFDGSAMGQLSVRNVGVGLLSLKAEPEDTRVTVTPASMSIAPGPPMKLSVLVNTSGLPGGPHEYGVRFSGNGGAGRAVVRFRLPVEVVDVPSVIDLGDRPAGRVTGDALRLRNTGPDPVTLRLRVADAGEQSVAPLVRPGTDQVTIRPGEMIAVPFRVELPPGVYGSLGAVIHVEGRTVEFTVAVRVVSRKIDLTVTPQALALGDMIHGEERAITVQITNRGDLAAEIRESHTAGELEVWIRKQTVQPGATITLAGRVRMNARGVGKDVRAVVPLADETNLRLSATVAKPKMPRIVAGVCAVGGLVAGGVLGASVGWFFGIAVVVAGFVAAGVFLAMSEG